MARVKKKGSFLWRHRNKSAIVAGLSGAFAAGLYSNSRVAKERRQRKRVQKEIDREVSRIFGTDSYLRYGIEDNPYTQDLI